MKQKTYKVEPPKPVNNTVFHLSSLENTLANKPYIISASKAATYSKLDKAKKREEKKLKKELSDYTKYDR